MSFFGFHIKFKLVLNIMYFVRASIFLFSERDSILLFLKTQVKVVVFVNPLLGLPLFLLLVSFDELDTNLSYLRRGKLS